MDNVNPTVYKVHKPVAERHETFQYSDDFDREEMTASEVFEHIRHVNDPEHPLSLEQLNVVSVRSLKCS